ncbi:MAG: hypothetical protein ACI4R8_05110 [Candidatus Caccovivens sp.]
MKRKWFFTILILAVVAVVLTIVFINLFREKDTKQLSEKVNSVTTAGYLSEDSEEYAIINAYFDDVYLKLTTGEEKAEVKNYQDTYKAYVLAGKFFNSQLVFSEYTETYKNNRKIIEKSFENAQEATNSFKQYIIDNKEVVGDSDYWTANTWANCKGFASTMFLETVDAFNLLQLVYQASVPSKLMKNDLTGLVFDTMTEFSEQTKENLNSDEGCGLKLYNLVYIYLTGNGEKLILNFNYNYNSQTKVANIKENGKESVYYQDFLEGRIEN